MLDRLEHVVHHNYHYNTNKNLKNKNKKGDKKNINIPYADIVRYG